MIVVMQCAKTKQAHAGRMRTGDGRPVGFVARPELAPAVEEDLLYVRPDDICDSKTGRTWREQLADYNADYQTTCARRGTHPADNETQPWNDPEVNPLGLLPMAHLYRNKTYRLLLDTLGFDHLYVFSGGWGLVRSDYLIPHYDITLSPGASGPDLYKRRLPADPYRDFNMLPADTAEPVVYLGSKVYVPLFCELTQAVPAPRTIYFNSKQPPDAPGCELRRFDIAKKMDWHYDCAKALVEKFPDLP